MLGLFVVTEGGLLLKDQHDQTLRSGTARPTTTGRPGEALPVLWPVPDFRFVDQEGRSFARADLSGRVWIADFIYTRCTSVCPVLSAKMVQLQRRLEDPRLRFVSFSIDPEHDTPAVLRDYARRWHPGEARWNLLSTTPPAVRALAAAVRLGVSQADDGEPLHGARFLLVDQHGEVRGVYSGEPTDGLEALERDARALLGAASPVATASGRAASEERGHVLYRHLGCDGCHANDRLAPPLAGLWGRTVHLAGGELVVAGAGYLRESILDPGRRLVDGYPAIMPSYRGQLDDADVDALVAWLRTLQGSDTARAAR